MPNTPHPPSTPQTTAPSTPGSPVGVLVTLSLAITSWLVFGAVGYADWATPSLSQDYPGLMVCNLYAQLLSLGAFGTCAHFTWPRSAGSLVVACTAGCGVTTVSTLFQGTTENFFQTAFWSLSGVYLGLLTESLTGLCGRALDFIAASSRAHHETYGIEPATLVERIDEVTKRGNERKAD
ncbi:hypothetical protein F5X68DRAFT_65222 [Plectosphaerella plurivora]|uniref:Uncharacterized protein n=1 Tax=Plectosphaerella plurivora TaxID=936078 RepID=A0A9P8VIB4_9PEZI|nr:hypothetical protein F5X68DRAFT_65222 [Plectosphaerella plurivora]